MADVLPQVELAAERAADVPVINDRAAPSRFPAGQAAEDGRLVRAALAGDSTAFTRLYEIYGRVVHGLLLARVGRDEVEDLVDLVARGVGAAPAARRSCPDNGTDRHYP